MQRDFVAEEGTLATIIEARDHICVVASPKYHPEVPGKGIECCLGILNLRFHQTNDEKNKDLVQNIERAMDVVTLNECWRT